MKIIDCEQGGPEWFKARAGIVTASQMDSLITPLFKARVGDGVETFLCEKLAERVLGYVPQTFGGGVLEQGSLREGSSLAQVNFLYGTNFEPVGFITTDDGRIGCSPDGWQRLPSSLGGENIGIELKNPQPTNHLKWLRAGILPKEHAAQVHGSMLVTGASKWIFASFHPKFPPFVLVVRRDGQIIDAIRAAIEAFNLSLDAAHERLLQETT